jgi:hypothetical protein
MIPWDRLRRLPDYPVTDLRPVYLPSRALAKSWLDFADVLIAETRGPNMIKAAQYLIQLSTGNLASEGPIAMPWHTSPPSEMELTIERLARVPKSTLQRLPAAFFSCTLRTD